MLSGFSIQRLDMQKLTGTTNKYKMGHYVHIKQINFTFHHHTKSLLRQLRKKTLLWSHIKTSKPITIKFGQREINYKAKARKLSKYIN